MPVQPVKPHLIRLVKLTKVEENHLIERLSPEEREVAGSFENWSVRDMLAHTNEWKNRAVERLEAAAGRTSLTEISDVEQVNRYIYDKHQAQGWQETFTLCDNVHAALVKALEQFPEDGLFNIEPQPMVQGRALWYSILGDGFLHPILHYSYYYRDQANILEAERLQDLLFSEETSIDDSPRTLGVATYNRACFSALCGQTDRAIELLSEAFRLAPDLKEWSREDTDLVSLHGNPEFIKMVS